MKWVIASDNQGKIKEIQSFFGDAPLTLMRQGTFNVSPIEETGLSFVENAILKARHASACSDLPALADDSGLAVDVLGGAPGIYSARYAGVNATDQDNINKLLQALSPFAPDERTAQFHCAIAFMRHPHDPVPIIAQAQWEGIILTEPQGVEGFGYDPVFYIPGLSCTAAQLPKAQKNKLSHRAQALTLFVQQIKHVYPELFTS